MCPASCNPGAATCGRRVTACDPYMIIFGLHGTTCGLCVVRAWLHVTRTLLPVYFTRLPVVGPRLLVVQAWHIVVRA